MKADKATFTYGAGVLDKLVDSLRDEVQGVHSGAEDIEFIHRARVASRRLRAVLPIFDGIASPQKTRRWLKQIRSVTQALGAARDLDVQIVSLTEFLQSIQQPDQQAGAQRLLVRWRQQRESLHSPVTGAMEELLHRDVLEQMHLVFSQLAEQPLPYTAALYQHSARSNLAYLEALLSFEGIVTQPDQIDQLHQMRIAAKRLRYTLETFAPLYANQLKPSVQAVKMIQDLLGNLHDGDVWLALLPQFIADEEARTIAYFGDGQPMQDLLPGIYAFQKDRAASRAAAYQQFTEAWQGWQANDLWQELRDSLTRPLLHPQDIYPPAPAYEENQPIEGFA